MAVARATILLAVFVSVRCGQVPYCRAPLNQSHFERVHGWDSVVSCRLRPYRTQQVVQCLDRMSALSDRRPHLVVIGDSRMRQQFFNLISAIPDYDLQWNGFTRLRWSIHHDMDADSAINNVRISFRWRPLFDATLVEEVDQWNNDSANNAPTFILLGSSVHHMFQLIEDNHQWFEQQLELLAPVLHRLTDRARIVWWSQNPIIESYEETGEFGSDITIQKIRQYDKAARRVFQNSGVQIWDSGRRLAEEYIRSCHVHKRRDLSKSRDCYDFVHTGHVALYRSTQFLLNYLCNSFLFK